MDVRNLSEISGNLRISTDVIEKIAKLAALEIEGVYDVTLGNVGVMGAFRKINIKKIAFVELCEGVAEITINVSVKYGARIPSVCEKVQNNIKNSVQSMTNVTVSKVNVIVTGAVLENIDL